MHTKDSIRAKINEGVAKNDWRWINRAIRRLYEFQTPDEQAAGRARHHNGKGFNRPDSMTAHKIIQRLDNRIMRTSDWAKAHKLALKYAGQLAEFANIQETKTQLAKVEAQAQELAQAIRRHVHFSEPYSRFA